MTKIEFAVLFAELMQQYNKHRLKWLKTYGDDTGFDDWFRKQALNKIHQYGIYDLG